MNVLFASQVAHQEYKNWERAFNRRPVRRTPEIGLDLSRRLQGVFKTVGQLFTLPQQYLTVCQLNPTQCSGSL